MRSYMNIDTVISLLTMIRDEGEISGDSCLYIDGNKVITRLSAFTDLGKRDRVNIVTESLTKRELKEIENDLSSQPIHSY